MHSPSRAFVKAGLARLAARFPNPKPLFAELFVESADAMLEVVFVTAARRRKLRSLFPGMSDSEIVNQLIDTLFEDVGIT